jgi:hypothetical protein
MAALLLSFPPSAKANDMASELLDSLLSVE